MLLQLLSNETEQRLFYFTMPGAIENIPSFKAAQIEDGAFSAFTNDKMNAVAWSVRKGNISIIVGRVSVSKLLSIAKASIQNF